MATGYLVVGVIDIGTTYSGWAYSFRNEFHSNPTKASVKQWYSGCNLITEKTPTCVLIKPDGKTLEAFGYDAENRYSELADKGIQKNYYYFKRFKIKLNKKLGEKLNRNITTDDEMGRSLPALDVYAMSIKFLVDDMSRCIQRRMMDFRDSDIYFVLTVPPTWPEGGKPLFREAAGYGSNRILIVLESEAASAFHRHLSEEQTVNKTSVLLSQMEAGMKYMILDAGGDTKITIHEVGKAGNVKEVHAIRVDGTGGGMVDAAFEDMLIEVLGERVYIAFQQTGDWLDFWRNFEIKKRGGSTHSKGVVIKLPMSLTETCQSIAGKSLSNAFANSRFRDMVKVRLGRIQFTFESFFDGSVASIIRQVKEILRKERVIAILMVGAFSESNVLPDAIRGSFPDIKLVVPFDPSTAVLKGALILGHSLKSSREHVPRYVLTPMSDKHDEKTAVSKTGKMAKSRELSRSQVNGSDFVHDISCTSCSEDDKNAEAEYHCTNCRSYFCATCVSYHNRVFKTHTLLDKNALGFDQGQQSPSASASSTLKDVCKIHAGEVVKMYCKQHDVVCCTVCVAVDHRSCNGVHYIPEIAKKLLKPNEERSTVASLRQVKTNVESLKLKREGDFSQAEKRLDGIVTKVKNMKTRIVQRTETLEKASVDKAQQLHRSIADGISSDIKSLENILERIDKELSNMEKRKSDDEAQLFVQVKQAEQECSKYNKCMKSIQVRNDKQLNFQIDKEIESTLATKFDFWM